MSYRKEVSRAHRKKFNEGFHCEYRSEKVVPVGKHRVKKRRPGGENRTVG